jgi:uncharacterized membrane protein (DUF485 family)
MKSNATMPLFPLRIVVASALLRTLKHRSFEFWTTIVLYVIAILSFVVGISLSHEWIHNVIPAAFVTSVVVVPIVAITFAFLVQIISLMQDSEARLDRVRSESEFLSAIERCQRQSIIQQMFLGLLLKKWGSSLKSLNAGLITIQEGYWDVCADFHALARKCVECTSAVPLAYWEKNDELKLYLQRQVNDLVSQRITVTRTFILGSKWSKDEWEIFFRVVVSQLQQGFYVFYIALDDLGEDTNIAYLTSDLWVCSTICGLFSGVFVMFHTVVMTA